MSEGKQVGNNKRLESSLDQQEVRRPRWIVKIGSSLITNNGTGLQRDRLLHWCKEIVALRGLGIDVVLVSSGSVAEGAYRLGMEKRPKSNQLIRAAAAVGQTGLIQAYESIFLEYDVRCAQLLFTHDDLSQRDRYLNARSTIQTLLSLGVVPIVNENDTILVDEIRLGDNDRLGALVANLVEAESLVILTDQSAMYTADPSLNPEAVPLKKVKANDARLFEMAGGTGVSGVGSGGMRSKVEAARLAARSGAKTFVVSGLENNILQRLYNGEELGTYFVPNEQIQPARKRWLAAHLQTKGTLTLDDGAVKSLTYRGSSLLAVGIKAVTGTFYRGDAVECVSESGQSLAVGLSNYSSDEVQMLKGQPSKTFSELLGYLSDEAIIHRDNMVLK